MTYSYHDIERIRADANDRIAGEINALEAGPNEVRRLLLTFAQVRCVLEAAEELAPTTMPGMTN